MLRALIRETLKLGDVELSRQRPRLDAPSGGMGQPVRVALDGRTWLTSSQAEVDRVIASGGRIVGGAERLDR